MLFQKNLCSLGYLCSHLTKQDDIQLLLWNEMICLLVAVDHSGPSIFLTRRRRKLLVQLFQSARIGSDQHGGCYVGPCYLSPSPVARSSSGLPGLPPPRTGWPNGRTRFNIICGRKSADIYQYTLQRFQGSMVTITLIGKTGCYYFYFTFLGLFFLHHIIGKEEDHYASLPCLESCETWAKSPCPSDWTIL